MKMLDQGSDDWHKWRLSGIGSSDAPIILGVSPYKTPYQLWMEKTGKAERNTEQNWAQARGNNLEPKARAHYELLNDCEMPATLAEHATYPFLRASLDGFNEKEKIILEIKCPGKDDHALAKEGKIPPKYIPQLDHQLLVTGARMVHYYSFDGSHGILVEHHPDIPRIQALLSAELDFWKLIEFDTAPEYSDKDFIKIKDKSVLEKIRKWKRKKLKLTRLEDEEAELKAEIIGSADHPIMTGAGVKIQKITRKGAVDYSKIEELKKVDLEKYRKKSSESWRLDIL